ncbi:DUF551 domain-containing protein [Salmonella enterica subsp. enterica serovar Agona]|nr:DUF551 domain-containing protein [Salmonella enterica]EBR8838009.1 DUF551 domain-containing protein [Salmonella enterica subsp. enterica serovar Agona]ECN2653031.1 DUF551 domain-containing protein [Salmonella enterica subsp. enterica serovar Agona]ECT0890113.1 DUF551 domain-containing protein [Salmonella enterica subsp. enterica serovar Agona]
MTTITDKKQYPGEQYLNELITNIEFAARAPVEVVRAMAAELQKRREADSAEPIAYIFKHPAGKLFWALTDESNKDQSDVIPVYAAPPVPVVPAALPENDDEDGHDIDYLEPSEVYSLGRTAGWNACRAAMLHGAEPVSQTYKLPVNTPCQDAPAHIWLQTAGVWPEDGELSELTWCSHNQHHDDTLYVRADLVNGNSPVTPDGWISCSDRMPDTKTAVLVAVEFDRKGDWRMKWATYIPRHPDANDGWVIPGASWIPSHWMPLPEPPQEVNRG